MADLRLIEVGQSLETLLHCTLIKHYQDPGQIHQLGPCVVICILQPHPTMGKLKVGLDLAHQLDRY